MLIVVQLNPAAAKSARATRTREASGGVLRWLDRPLRPVHPSASDESLASFFYVEVDDPAEAAGLVSRLLEDPVVEAAYIKPEAELP